MRSGVEPEVRGPIPRVERQEPHYRFLWAARPPFAMVGLKQAARIATFDKQYFPPETDVVLTSTIADSELIKYTFEDELRIINKLEPNYVIPFDFPVYGDMSPATRVEHVNRVARGTVDMHMVLTSSEEDSLGISNQLNIPHDLVRQSPNATVLPLIKGTTREEREIMEDIVRQLNPPIAVKYGVQYMTVGGSGNYPQLRKDLQEIQAETNNYPMLVIGLLSPEGKYSLGHVPENVIAAAGTNQWVKAVEPSSATFKQVKRRYNAFEKQVADALGVQTVGMPTEPGEPPIELESFQGKAVSDDLTTSVAGATADGEYGFGQRKRPDGAIGPAEAGRLEGKRNRGEL